MGMSLHGILFMAYLMAAHLLDHVPLSTASLSFHSEPGSSAGKGWRRIRENVSTWAQDVWRCRLPSAGGNERLGSRGIWFLPLPFDRLAWGRGVSWR